MAPEQHNHPDHIPSQPQGNHDQYVGSMAGVFISPGTIYNAVMNVSGKVDGLVIQHTTTQTVLGDHESRLRSLEHARWPLPTLSVLIALAALVVAIVVAMTN